MGFMLGLAERARAKRPTIKQRLREQYKGNVNKLLGYFRKVLM